MFEILQLISLVGKEQYLQYDVLYQSYNSQWRFIDTLKNCAFSLNSCQWRGVCAKCSKLHFSKKCPHCFLIIFGTLDSTYFWCWDCVCTVYSEKVIVVLKVCEAREDWLIPSHRCLCAKRALKWLTVGYIKHWTYTQYDQTEIITLKWHNLRNDFWTRL